jgi:imidazoleglycerol-phosphate dehydratase
MTRQAQHERTTTETRVAVSVDLDGSGAARVDTGVGMLDHLLTSFAHHALIDVEISTEGDLVVDDHHSVEDTLLVLGMAMSEALGDRSGIQRFGDAAVPMDEALARCAVDYGGRPYAVVDVAFRADRIGDLSTQMVEHAIEAFARTVGATINISSTGRNDHHVAEATFKALARATRSAIATDDRRIGIASTKGTT